MMNSTAHTFTVDLTTAALIDARAACSALLTTSSSAGSTALSYHAAQRRVAALSGALILMRAGMDAADAVRHERDRYEDMARQSPAWAAPEYQAGADALSAILQQVQRA